MGYSREEKLRMAKKSIQVLLYIAESKNPLFRGVKVKKVMLHTSGEYNSLYFETTIPFSIADPDHGSLCYTLGEILKAIMEVFPKYELSPTIDFNLKTDEDSDDMIGLFTQCHFEWETHEEVKNGYAVYGYEYNFYTAKEN